MRGPCSTPITPLTGSFFHADPHWIARTGTAWRDLHSHFGTWNSVYRQFRRWTQAGIWDVMLEALNETGAGNDSVQM
jgi:hypothetical protein